MTELLIDILKGTWSTLCTMAPYLLFGFLVAGLLSVFIRPEWVERHLGGRRILSVLKAALFGVPLPLCSCGVIPVSAGLRRHGAGKGATTSFLISTPQTGVDSVLVTWSLLGPVYAIFRPVAALLAGVFGGAMTLVFGGAEDAAEAESGGCRGERCSPAAAGNRLSCAIRYGFVALPRDIGRALLVGLVLAGLISAVVPDGFFVQYLGTGLLAMLVMMALGIPVYVCATASVPVAAALIWKGATPGAALVFLMTGPATNAATLATVWKTMGRRTAVIYLFSVASSALAAGLLLDLVYRAGAVAEPAGMAHEEPALWEAAAAVALLAVLIYALAGPLLAGKRAQPETEEAGAMKKILTIKGMTCSHCVAAVKRALTECSGVRSAEVDLGTGRAAVTGDALNVPALRQAVESVGYSVTQVD